MLHASNAEYGVAVANLGSQALTAESLCGSGSAVWSLVGQFTQPLFNPGLPAEKRTALAAFDTASANYQAAVLDALRDVADLLGFLENNSDRLHSFSAQPIARKSLSIPPAADTNWASKVISVSSSRSGNIKKTN